MATSKGVIKNINTDQHRILADIMRSEEHTSELQSQR